jgi:hypothetical protein
LQSGRAASVSLALATPPKLEDQLHTASNDYWAAQVAILAREVTAWSAQADGKPEEAAAAMRSAANEEDGLEKLPVTPGPIVPAREQLGYLLLEQHQPDIALKEFRTALTDAPGRRGALNGATQAAELSAARK